MTVPYPSGLKDALSVGTKNAVNLVSKVNGYFGNEAIMILLPDNIQKAAELVGKVGYQKQVDEFILSMNRAAEKAASYFADAIKGMSIEDARKILSGGDTAATEYFKSKASSIRQIIGPSSLFCSRLDIRLAELPVFPSR